MRINNTVIDLINYAIDKDLIQADDFEYVLNRLSFILKLEELVIVEKENKEIREFTMILNEILDYSFEKGLFEPNSLKQRDLFESSLMDVFAPLPSDLNKTFHHLYKKNPVDATDYFYNMSKNNNYIKSDRIAKNILWKSVTKYGIFDMTINLSKPEKDPRDIIASSKNIDTLYPLCLLCKENVGFYGNSNHPGRTNHRIIKIKLNNEDFYLQYSPYVYYNEHSIVLMKEHNPMNVSKSTFIRLFDFVDMFPHYFLGSNAGLPIVGGSILNHEHYQGGRHHFPIEDAEEKFIVKIDDVSIKKLVWPLSVLRLESVDKSKLIEKATQLFNFWEKYTDKDAGIYSYTDSPHNAITPIARKNGETYILDMTLRNNLTSKDFPLGIFHPHPIHHNIKKENIGLIEVMGLAVLPARLEEELEVVKNALINNTSIPSEFSIHEEWLKELKDLYNSEDIDQFIKDQVASKFMRCLEDSGVFKQDELGNKLFDKFINALVESLSK